MESTNLQSNEIGEFAKALAAAQGELKNIGFDRENPHFKSKYATLGAVLNEIRPVLSKHKLAFSQLPDTATDGSVLLYTQLTHESGQWQRCSFPVKGARGNGPQDMGSAMTYARRYCACAIVGVAGEEDDDGNAAQAEQAPRTGNYDKRRATKSEKWDELSRPADLSPKVKQMLDAFARYGVTMAMIEARLRKPAAEADDADFADLHEAYAEMQENNVSPAEFFPGWKPKPGKSADRINTKFGGQPKEAPSA